MNRPRRAARRPWPAFAAVVIVLAAAADAFARGGGGGNFDGGGGSGGGGGGGGDGLALWLILRLIQLAIRHPAIGVPLLLIAIFLFWQFGRNARQTYTIGLVRRGNDAASLAREDVLAAKLRERDPAFDASQFKTRVRAAFMKTQAAWCAQDLTPIRPFASDGVHERFALQLDEERDLGYRDQMDGLRVDVVSIVHATLEGAFDALTVRVVATATDYRVSLETGMRLSGNLLPEQFVEFWTFLRRRGAKPQPGRPGLLEGHCPNCGDSVEGNQFADCRSCRTRLRSGEFDWVLAEISQSGAWSPREARFAPGVADLVAADPEFSPEAMEDRASVAFWRWAMAMRTGDAKPLAGVASPEVIRDAAVARDGGQAWRYVGECGVGAVEIVGVVHEPASHAVLVEVRWSGTNFEARAGAPPQRRDRTGLRSWLLVFERAASAKSRIADSFSSAHCRGCGAPAEGSAAACNYCGEALSDVNNGWTLTRMTTRLEATGRVLCERLRSSSSAAGAAPAPPPLPEPIPVGLVAWAARVALTDGVVDAREREGLRRLAAHASIPAQRLDELIAEATAAQTELALPGDAAQARTWFDAAARLAVADGVVSSAETALLDRLAVPAHMAPADVRLCINRARAEVLQDARAALRRAASS